MASETANESKARWKTAFRKLKSPSEVQPPKPQRRYNQEYHPDDVEEGYFCDSIFTLMSARDALRSATEVQSQPQSSSDRSPTQNNPSTSKKKKASERVEIDLDVWTWETGGSDPIGITAYRLVRNFIAKKFKRSEQGSKRSSQQPSTSQSSKQEDTGLAFERT